MASDDKQTDYKSLLKRSFLKIEDLQSRLEKAVSGAREPIAVVGIGCRFPGTSNDPEKFWQVLRDGVDTTVDVPSDRWDADSYYDPDTEAPGKMYTKRASFLGRVDTFDPNFFGISPREAISIDPQQRLLLEVCWEALENAGQSPFLLSGSKTGVFVGISSNDYTLMRMRGGDDVNTDPYFSMGVAHSIASGRISYTLGFEGPSISVDTACSSSLVAVHLACQSLLMRECKTALAGGVNLILSPEGTIMACKARMLSPDGRCKTFDASADGYGRGEGCGVVVLKRLSDAEKDGNPVMALIKGTAANQDGRSNGLTAPRGASQRAVIREALEKAGIEPSDVGYLEAHGTGTSLGDPIELQSISSVLCQGRENEKPLALGAVKSNIGHLEAAAGIASLIKVVLSVQKGEIPPSLHVNKLNPIVPWKEMPMKVATEHQQWNSEQKRRIAGASSFGFSGTNVHAIVENYAPVATEVAHAKRPLQLFTLSARSETALDALVRRYLEYFESERTDKIGDICYTANLGRSHFEHRLAIVGRSKEEFAAELEKFAGGEDSSELFSGSSSSGQSAQIAFLFTGQGSQDVGMGRVLYETEPVYRDVIDNCNAKLLPLLEMPLTSVLYPDSEKEEHAQHLLRQTAYTQPALFVVEYALAELWKSWGIEPSAAVGHSVGEYVAACIAGVFSLDDGLRLIAERGRLMQNMAQEGGMAAVFADEKQCLEVIKSAGEPIVIAAVNSPVNTVITGAEKSLERVIEELESNGINAQRLIVSHAFHSPLMAPMLEEFGKTARSIQYSEPRIDLLSNVTGCMVRKNEVLNADYWCQHILQPVRFQDSMETLHNKGYREFLEIGPHPVLLGMAGQSLQDLDCQWSPSLRRGWNDLEQMLKTLGALHVRGHRINWRGVEGQRSNCRVTLPTYPFERERYWTKSVNTVKEKFRALSSFHPLLGKPLRSSQSDHVFFDTTMDLDHFPFLADHQFYGKTVVAASVYLEMMQAAVSHVLGSGTNSIIDFNIHVPLMIEDDCIVKVQTVVSGLEKGEVHIDILSQTSKVSDENVSWTLHASGKVQTGSDDAIKEDEAYVFSQEDLASRCSEQLDAEGYYSVLEGLGVRYGTAFRGIAGLWCGKTEIFAKVSTPTILEGDIDFYHIHPGLLDTCFQIMGGIQPEGEGDLLEKPSLFMPMGLDKYILYERAAEITWAHGVIRSGFSAEREMFSGDIYLISAAGKVAGEIKGLRFKRLDQKALKHLVQEDLSRWLYALSWQKLDGLDEEKESFDESGQWLILADSKGLGADVSKRLTAKGETCRLVYNSGNIREEQNQFEVVVPGNREALRSIVEAIRAQGRLFRGVIYLWSLDVEVDEFPGPNAYDLSCNSPLHIVQVLAEAGFTNPPHFTLVTEGAMTCGGEGVQISPLQSTSWGLGRVVASEHPELQIRLVDLDPMGSEEKKVQALWEEVIGYDRRENQISYHDNTRYGLRMTRAPEEKSPDSALSDISQGEPYQLEMSSRGVLENLTFQKGSIVSPGPGEVQICIDASGLNFRDVLNALDMYPGEPGPLGNECVGRISAVGEGVSTFQLGDMVLALTPQAFCSHVNAKVELTTLLPPQLSVAEAATIPMAFLTAHYALFGKGGIMEGEKILIHAAAGGVGMAAVQLAQEVGAVIFATAGNSKKRDFLRSLGVKHVLDSRSIDFADQILEITEGQGVDIVLNSLAGDFIPASLTLLSKGGRFLELGKNDFWDEQKISVAYPGVSYFAVFLGDVCLEDPTSVQDMFGELMKSFRDGRLRPLPYKRFNIEEVQDAFRFMAQAKHIGKIVVDQRTFQKDVPLRKDASYLITGGTGGLGLVFARKIIEKGAQKLFLFARHTPSEKVLDEIQVLEESGAEVTVIKGDVSKRDDLAEFIGEMNADYPLRGIIHAAGQVDDGVLIHQNKERFARVLEAKVEGAWWLHKLIEKSDLDFFVMCSAGAALFGSPGQGNYAAANAFLDSLSHYRRASGLSALSINWGPWAEVGMASALGKSEQKRWASMGMGMINPREGVHALELALKKNVSQLAVLPIDWPIFLRQFAGRKIPVFFSKVTSNIHAAVEAESVSDAPYDFRLLLQKSDPEDQVHLLLDHVREQIVSTLGIKSSTEVRPDRGLTELGMDSLMAVEISNRLKRSLGISLASTLAFDYPTLEALTDYLAEVLEIRLNKSSQRNNETAAQSQAKKRVENLSEKDAENALMKELEDTGY